MERQITQWVSVKCAWFSFAAMMLVVAKHAGEYLGPIHDYSLGLVARCAVPWFFFCAGVFFCQSSRGCSSYELLLRKFRSLFVPYVIWCAYGLIILLIRKGLSGGEVMETLMKAHMAFGFANAIPFGNTPMWFLRSLIWYMMIFIVIRAVFAMFFREGLLEWITVVLWCCCIGASVYLRLECIFGTPTSPLYFILGYILADRICSETRMVSRWKIAGVILIVVLQVVLRHVHAYLEYRSLEEQFVRNAIVCTAIYGSWIGYDLIVFKPVCPKWLSHTFIPYCMHFQLVYFAFDVWSAYFGVTSLSKSAYYVMMVVGLPVILVYFSVWLSNCHSLLFLILSGGRLPHKRA